MIVDKATYQALCELYIPPRQVSLRKVHGDANITGALLQRQIDYLVPLAHKSTVRDALPQFVRDAVDLCATPKRALHRVRLLLKALSITYVLGPEVLAQVGSTEGIWQQIDSGLNVCTHSRNCPFAQRNAGGRKSPYGRQCRAPAAIPCDGAHVAGSSHTQECIRYCPSCNRTECRPGV